MGYICAGYICGAYLYGISVVYLYSMSVGHILGISVGHIKNNNSNNNNNNLIISIIIKVIIIISLLNNTHNRRVGLQLLKLYLSTCNIYFKYFRTEKIKMMPFQSNNLNPVNQQTLVGQYIFICKIKYHCI